MPKLRRLSGADVILILQGFGFEVIRIRGSHHVMRRTIEIKVGKDVIRQTQTISVPAHGKQSLGDGLLKSLFRDLQQYISEDELKNHFYTD